MLPNLSGLSLHCPPCGKRPEADVGVTRQRFSVLLPGMTLAPGQAEPDVEDEDKTCQICSVYLRWPAGGFDIMDGAVYLEQNAFDELRNPDAIAEARPAYHENADAAAERIRMSNPRRTQIELLVPGCGHQFHRMCIERWVRGTQQGHNKCPICKTDIDNTIRASLTSSGQGGPAAAASGVVRQRSGAPSTVADSDDDDDPLFGLGPLVPVPMPPAPMPSFNNDDEGGQAQPPENEPPTELEMFQDYITEVSRMMTELRVMIDRYIPSYVRGAGIPVAYDSMITAVQEVYRELLDNIATYNEQPGAPPGFAPSDTPLHTAWEKSIGDVYILYRSFERALVTLNQPQGGTPTYGLIVIFRRKLHNLLQALMAVDSNPPIAPLLSTDWVFMEDETGIMDGINRTDATVLRAFGLQRNVEMSTEVSSSLALQPIRGWIAMATPIDRYRDLVTLATMLLEGAKEASLPIGNPTRLRNVQLSLEANLERIFPEPQERTVAALEIRNKRASLLTLAQNTFRLLLPPEPPQVPAVDNETDVFVDYVFRIRRALQWFLASLDSWEASGHVNPVSHVDLLARLKAGHAAMVQAVNAYSENDENDRFPDYAEGPSGHAAWDDAIGAAYNLYNQVDSIRAFTVNAESRMVGAPSTLLPSQYLTPWTERLKAVLVAMMPNNATPPVLPLLRTEWRFWREGEVVNDGIDGRPILIVLRQYVE